VGVNFPISWGFSTIWGNRDERILKGPGRGLFKERGVFKNGKAILGFKGKKGGNPPKGFQFDFSKRGGATKSVCAKRGNPFYLGRTGFWGGGGVFFQKLFFFGGGGPFLGGGTFFALLTKNKKGTSVSAVL